MGSQKSADALMIRFNYEEKRKKVVFLKPQLENRNGDNIIASRIRISHECEYAEEFLKDYKGEHFDAVIVDEIQFLKPKYINNLRDLVDKYNITVICYGLRTDFKSNMQKTL